MIIDRLDQELDTTRKAMGLRAYRQELLASNIANADTPHFKARDLDFKAALEAARSGKGDGSVDLSRTHPAHLPAADATPFAGSLRYRTEFQGAVDGNTVNMDVERAAFADNAVQVEALLTFVREQFRYVTAALQASQ